MKQNHVQEAEKQKEDKLSPVEELQSGGWPLRFDMR